METARAIPLSRYLPGLILAVVISSAWTAIHIWGVFFAPLTLTMLPLIILVVLVQTWLYAGLFIIAHDCMHSSFLPGRPKANHIIGQAILLVYAGFPFGKLRAAHHAHHDHVGTAEDPDFNAANPKSFMPWFGKWFLTYFGPVQFGFILGLTLIYMFVLGAGYFNILIFWALPALLSSLQLFYFGTYLPHRHDDDSFADEHNARTNDYPYLLSLLTCFHFGYHHEHHLYPHEPWWRLPARYKERRS